MKNQYLGDINDYRKYGILRILARTGLSPIGIGWMRTANDNRRDGNRKRYLEEMQKERYDPELYGQLRRLVSRNNPSLKKFVSLRLIPRGKYFDRLLTSRNRDKYFEDLLSAFRRTEVIFLDPDNGLEVQSVARGSRESPRYLYNDEVSAITSKGKSLVFYQHFPREKRKLFVERIRSRLRSATDINPLALKAGNVAYFFLFQPRHRLSGRKAVAEIARTWHPEICRIQRAEQ